MYVLGHSLDKRFHGLFGLTVSKPADLSGLYNIKVPENATGNLDISHQQQSAGATGTGYWQHQGKTDLWVFSVCDIFQFLNLSVLIHFSF